MLLTDVQLYEMGNCKLEVDNIRRRLAGLNEYLAKTGLPIRLVSEAPLLLANNDISKLAHAHQLALEQLRTEALERMTA